MGSGVTDFGANRWLSALFGIGSLPTGYYLALCTDQPGEAMDGLILIDLEPDDGAYARRLYGTGAGNWAADDSWLTNVNDIVFPRASVDWGLVPYYAMLDAAYGGNLWAWGEFDNAPNIAAGQALTLPAGGVVLGLQAITDSIAV